MVIYYCDLCNREIKENESRYGLSMVDIDKDKPAMPSREVCPFCKVKIEKYFNEWRPE